jgi:hypothetical protein
MVNINQYIVQDYLKELLEYYDFSVRKEYYISENERIDIYGYNQALGNSIGIEVSFTSNPVKDAERIARMSFDLTFVVVKDKGLETKVEFYGVIIPIVHYDSFESELRRLLNISPTMPKFGTFNDWIRRKNEMRVELSSEPSKDKLTDFIRLLEDSGLGQFVNDAVNTLAKLYIAGECLPSEYRDVVRYHVLRYSGKVTDPQYIDSGLIEPNILGILKSYSLVSESARGSGELRKYFIHLTKEGEKIAKSIITNRIKLNSNELDSLISEYGKLAGIIAIGTTKIEAGKERMSLRIVKIVERKAIRDLLPYCSQLKLKEGEMYDMIAKSHHELDNHDLLTARVESGKFHPLIASFCHFVTYYCYDLSKSFFEKLESLDLALEIPVYGSYGQYLWNEFRAPAEVAEFILGRIKPGFDPELLRQFGALKVIYSVYDIRHPETARQFFNEYLRFYEIPIEYVVEELDLMNENGLTSRYIERAGTAPFIVLNRDEFEKYIVSKIDRIVKNALK